MDAIEEKARANALGRGTNRLIDLLVSEDGKKLPQIKSSSGDVNGEGKFSWGDPKATPKITPLEDLATFLESLKGAPEETRAQWDRKFSYLRTALDGVSTLGNIWSSKSGPNERNRRGQTAAVIF